MRRRFFLGLAALNAVGALLLDGTSRIAMVFGVIGCVLFAFSTPKDGQR